jgi:predicted nucleic acid-binding Zn ribbon protein
MEEQKTPKPARRLANRKSTMKSGRTIGEKREKLETASERTAIHKKNKAKRNARIIITSVGFLAIAIIIVLAILQLFRHGEDDPDSDTIIVPVSPTIEIIDEASSLTNEEHLTSRMKEFIGQVEACFRELGYVPVKAVIPVGAIREVDLYLEGQSGYIKMIIDRGSGVSVEDADRMIRYLASIGVEEYQYIDVRLERQAYWR